MELKNAIDLIRFNPRVEENQKWADLGCGTGLFTKALANLLPKGSHIHAIDADKNAIKQIPVAYKGIHIESSVGDFTDEAFQFEEMDGIMMANSLHYVKDKENFLKRMINSLSVAGYFLLIEYDLEKPNRWVPYPIAIAPARELFFQYGAKSFEVLNERRSLFGDQQMYAALITR